MLGLVVALASVAHLLAPAQALQHTVEAGEVLSTIADQYSVSVDELTTANDLDDPDLIYSGQVIDIPGSKNERPTKLPPHHTVAGGETLSGIASTYGLSIAALAQVNGIESPSLIFPGQRLTLDTSNVVIARNPAPSQHGFETTTSRRTPSPKSSDPSGRIPTAFTHTVVPGDTLWGISDHYGLSIDQVININNLGESTVITPGQQLSVFNGQSFGIDIDDLPLDLVTDPYRLRLSFVFDKWADAYDVPPELIKALAWFESGWNNEVESSAGALGIGQVLPITADFVSTILLGQKLDPYDQDDNIQISTRYLRYLLD
ncbi:MAG: LysM peptidoglycan-binding domain-containing protein, partial [Acidimicrobiales bacterium]